MVRVVAGVAVAALVVARLRHISAIRESGPSRSAGRTGDFVVAYQPPPGNGAYIEQQFGQEPMVVDGNGNRYSLAQWQAMHGQTVGAYITTGTANQYTVNFAERFYPAQPARCDCFACRQHTDAETQRRQAAFSERLQFEQWASEKARALLLAWLSDKQRKRLDRSGWFEVTGSRGNTYRILPGVTFNVQLMRGSVVCAAFCAAPRGVPEADVHLAQALALMSDERAFLDVANRA